MLKGQKQLEEVNKYFSILTNYIEFQNSSGYFDINKYCENFFCELLNKVYDLELENLNKIKVNFPAVDLGDYSEGVCFQVTSSNGRKKIVETVEKFVENKLYEDFNELNILILGSKKNYKKSDIDTNGTIEFDIDKNVIDLKDLVKDISNLRNKRIREILEYLEENVDLETRQPSYLSGIKMSVAKIPNNCASYLRYLDVSNSIEAKDIVGDIKLFINDFMQLDDNTREIVYAIINKRNLIDERGIHFNHVEIRKYLRIEQSKLFEELRILYDRDYISSADDNGTEHDILGYWTKHWEVFNDLVNYCLWGNIDIKEMIVNLDFTLLD
ncbi:SMEK domain-containing protein [Neobacillus citreus]|uniref:SMEK domain-containing protein n=1 Tax=Neobacillus citreus TaxID=2833578 RepID=A0A942TAE3_9BACI|nr:SMEK domain-containing protein [Neobacillus citreus]MCH6265114.1 SMEK domain-containing protein [Neobacillus citreus]